MRKTNDTLLRYLQLLQLLPVIPNRKSTTQLRSELERLDSSYAVSARTTQRDLEKLSLIFPLSNDTEGRSNYWYWADSSYIQFPAMGKAQAFALVMAGKYLDKVLPPDFNQLLSTYVEKASKILEKSEFSLLDEKILKISSGPTLIHQQASPKVRQQVFDAVLHERQLDIRYKNRAGKNQTFEHLHPLGIVIKDEVSYLVAFVMPDKYRMQFALHRIKKALISNEKAHKEKTFSLQSYVAEESEFSYPVTYDEIKLKLRIDPSLVTYFQENSLSVNQTVEEIENEWFVTASTGDNADLRWWLLSYGDKVEIISPASLRTAVTQLLMNAMNQYLNNRIFTQEDKTMSYTGELNVEDGEFTLDAKSFITREGEVAFVLAGVDDYGAFTIEGKAMLTKDGSYVSGLLPTNYTLFLNEPGYVHLVFTKIQIDKNSCCIEGLWIEDGDEWEIDGVLMGIR